MPSLRKGLEMARWSPALSPCCLEQLVPWSLCLEGAEAQLSSETMLPPKCQTCRGRSSWVGTRKKAFTKEAGEARDITALPQITARQGRTQPRRPLSQWEVNPERTRGFLLIPHHLAGSTSQPWGQSLQLSPGNRTGLALEFGRSSQPHIPRSATSPA